MIISHFPYGGKRLEEKMSKIRRNILVIMAMAVIIAGFTGVESIAANNTSNTTNTTNTTNSTEKDAKSETAEKTIPKGITIEGTDVSGQTVEKATKMVESNLGDVKKTTFKLVAGQKSVDATGKELSLCIKNDDVAERAANYGNEGTPLYRYKASKDLESGKGKDFKVSLTAKNADVAEYLEKNKIYLDTKVVNNGLKHENGTFSYVPGTQGTYVNVNASADKIADYISDGWSGGNSSVDLVCETKDPIGSQEELASVKDCLGSYNTDFSSSAAGRSQNVKNGCSKINGSILYPGETFSVTEAVVPFTAENGYELAASYENGQTVESYGGGICQVSSTLYNAVIRAELEIVQRNNHSMIVTYVPPSADAAIAEGILDFKFKNNQDTPIYIEGYCEGGKIYFSVYGKETRDSNRKIDFVSEVMSETEPGITFKYSSELPAGTIKKEQSAHKGTVARLWKVVTVNGVEQSRNVFNNSNYKPGNTIYAIGTNGLSPERKSAIDSAIASNDESTVRAAVAGAPVSTPQPQPQQQQQDQQPQSDAQPPGGEEQPAQ